MKAVILAGGTGTRLSEETVAKPKPMVEIGGKPILWHVMKSYSAHGINEFIICCGYKGYMVKEYFANYALHMSDITFNFQNHQTQVHERYVEPWKVTLVDTGLDTMTGGRLKRIKSYLSDETFCFTYGDGVSDVNISRVIDYHKQRKVLATLLAVLPTGRFGVLTLKEDKVTTFQEKPHGEGGWVNGGFFVLEPRVIDLIDGDATIWEREPLEQLAQQGQLAAFQHTGFWMAMDTLRDKNYLEALWERGQAPWRVR